MARAGGGVVCPPCVLTRQGVLQGVSAAGVVDTEGSWNDGPSSLGLIMAAARAGVQPPATLSFLPQPFPSTCPVPGTASQRDSPAAVLRGPLVQPDEHKR